MQTDRVPFKPDAELTEQPKAPLPQVSRDEKVSYMDDTNYHRMADMLEISYEDRKDIHTAEKLSFLADWAKEQTKSEDRLQQFLAIKDLSRRLGYTFKGNDLIT